MPVSRIPNRALPGVVPHSRRNSGSTKARSTTAVRLTTKLLTAARLYPSRHSPATSSIRTSISSNIRANSRREALHTVGSRSVSGRAEADAFSHQGPPSPGRAGASRSARYLPGSRPVNVVPVRRRSPQTRSTRPRAACSPPTSASRRSSTAESSALPSRKARSASMVTPSRRSSLIFSRVRRSSSL